ncbi:outer membrane protein assembly factor BamD [Halopseudomonas salegens]|uniref:Outer membrane protein assembly factor BamD, BamD/ComL family n=1 Tax=Halopseudomonas salegens TaxID=1434072 RepID=A0A1H2GBC9_9GAMM|nr:outer membrane protein assembly factor BamD [Halopseudomonas salegens]SDU16809.1 Outer membrane protein assembly factor BamD, BamD/ComL family [Halopseudomonas salegens]
MKHLWLPVVVSVLAGCAGTGGSQPVDQQAITEARAKLSLGGCDRALVDQVRRSGDAQLHQEAAFACLQQGSLSLTERLLQGYRDDFVDQEHADYSEYLWALAGVLHFELEQGDDRKRLETGREAHARLVRFVRDHPESSYRQDVVPRLEEIHEGMARSEYRLARLSADSGDNDQARQRMKYVTSAYPRSSAAADAQVWLERHNGAN